MQSQIPVPCSTRAFDTGGSKGQGEDWADACSVAIYPGQGLFDPRWQPRPGVTIVLPMSDEGPNLGNGCSEWELPEAQAAVDDLISHANRWAAAVLPLAFPRDSPDVYSCVYETEGGVPSGWMQELARDTFPGGNAVDARNLNSGDPGTYGAIAAALVTEISRAVQVSPRRRVCGADFNGDGQVDAQDMAALLNAWGTSAASFDLNCNGTVDAPDMAALLNAWGPCPQ
jgi:hypothetical protein